MLDDPNIGYGPDFTKKTSNNTTNQFFNNKRQNSVQMADNFNTMYLDEENLMPLASINRIDSNPFNKVALPKAAMN
jgi:hypothetical protein